MIARLLGATPFRAGLGIGLLAGASSSVVLLLAAVTQLDWGYIAALGLPGAWGFLAGWKVPSRQLWLGMTIGLCSLAIAWEVINSRLQPDNVYANGPFLIVGIVLFAGIWTVIASVGFVLAAILRRGR